MLPWIAEPDNRTSLLALIERYERLAAEVERGMAKEQANPPDPEKTDLS